jgi:predicted O-linked N-acetylglucosamine transferase (SPINDLY family)
VRAALRAGYVRAWAFACTVGGRTAKAYALMAQADYPGASQLLLRLVRKQPTNLELLLNLAFCHKRLGRKEAQLQLLQEAHRLDDSNPNIIFDLAQAMVDMRRSEEALPLMGLIKDEPGFSVMADRVLGSLAMGRGDATRAKDFQLSSWLSAFDNPHAGHSYLFPLAYAETDEARLAQEHQFWADTLPAMSSPDPAQALTPPSVALKALRQLPQPPAQTPNNKIRLAYWGADFREHSVRYFSRPLIENHDKTRFEVFIYSQNDAELPYDAQTDAFKAAADYFFDVALLSDAELEALIQSHQIDVLVELSGHTAGNRLPMLTRRLAAVQLTGLAYPPTTGLRNVDGKFMDPHIHTPNASFYYAENPLVLPNALWCFDPMTAVPDVGPPPLEKNGHITFACMGNLAKVTPQIVDCWSQILRALPSARLLIQSGSFFDSAITRAFEARLDAAQIDRAQIILSPAQPTKDFWTRYQEIDLILDTYPFNGGTTSCYSAYAGVPLLTLSGQSLISRVGRSIVSNLGFDTLAVDSYEQYVARALELARDPALLATFRREARTRFQQSSMGNGKKFAAEFEAAALSLLQQAQAGTLVNRSTVAPLPKQLLLQRAELVWYHGHVDGSRRILDLCLRHYPACGAAHVFRARQMARMGELTQARRHIVEHLHNLDPAAAADAHLLLATIALNLATPAPVQTALGALTVLKAQGHLTPTHLRHARLLAAAAHGGQTAQPAKRQGEWGVSMGAPGALRVLVLVPCMLESDLQALQQQARSQCTHPPGWDIEYRRCDPRDRIGAYNTALAESTHDMLVFMQPHLQLYQPALFTELARALQDADVVGCGGALRWVQKDWTLDLPAYKAWGLLRPSPVREGMVDMHLAGDFDGPLVPGAVVLDGKFLACRPATLRGIELDEDLYDSQWLAEEDWTNRLHAAGKRLLIHRNLGLLTASAGNSVQFGITQGQKQMLARLKLDPLALTIRNYETISAPVPDPIQGVSAMRRYFGISDADHFSPYLKK